MDQTATDAGTPIVSMTRDEYTAFLEQEVQATLGMSVAEFIELVRQGRVDWDNPDAFYVAGILGIGQNGHSRAA